VFVPNAAAFRSRARGLGRGRSLRRSPEIGSST
jgi:hypothetical protein